MVGKVTTAKGLRTTPWMWFMQTVSRSKIFSEKLKLELYPPFFLMRVKVLEISPCWRTIRMRLPLNTISRNPGGVMFGGYQAALGDPIAALACSRIFQGYSVWTRAMSIDFRAGGSKDLELKFHMLPEQEEIIRNELKLKGRSTPTFKYGFYLPDGTLSTLVTNTVAIRPSGYWKATTPPVNNEFLPTNQLSLLESKIRTIILNQIVSKYLSGEKLLASSFEDLLINTGNHKGEISRHDWKELFIKTGIDENHYTDFETLFDLLDDEEIGIIKVDTAVKWWKKELEHQSLEKSK